MELISSENASPAQRVSPGWLRDKRNTACLIEGSVSAACKASATFCGRDKPVAPDTWCSKTSNASLSPAKFSFRTIDWLSSALIAAESVCWNSVPRRVNEAVFVGKPVFPYTANLLPATTSGEAEPIRTYDQSFAPLS